ncbi:hypothetical protein CRM22_000607 [Opisthorchis felineus]|uniref:Pleckstrin homology domain-containing family A member 8 n=1 Tax=Opisthorchis felineus TaxID=147828 RepID=A0A4S2MEK7_OPIFE|nr:hypothetical protein CRM22_000607 [Opisthorchis felineus]
MEGFLLKWTNYMTGWQQRWFTLKDGILSYYRSQEEVNSGCKGSLRLSSCDLIVHTTDPRRFDLLLGEQRFYLRALSRGDRQRWVVAIGCCKAGVNVAESEDFRITESNTQAITTRQSELRLYHNLIVQQIKDLQGNLKEGVVPNIARIDEITGTLNAACSTFLATIDDLMSLIQPTNSPLSGSNVAQSADDPISGFPSPQPFVRGVLGPPSAGHSPMSWKTDSALHTWFPTDRAGFMAVGAMNNPSVNPSLYRSNRPNRLHKTFFSTMEFSFVDLRPNMSAQLDQSNNQLPGDFLSALDFAKACRSLFRIFDRISDFSARDAMIGRTFTTLQQVQADLLGNLERLEMAIQVYSSQTSARNQNGHEQPPCETPDSSTNYSSTISIGTLLRNDMKNDRTADAASFYKAILWLSRSLNFVREFLHLLFTLPPPSPDDVTDGRGAVPDDSLSVAATEAYSRCLRSFHQWSLRGVAMIVIKSLPTRSQFLRLLLQDDLNSDSPSQALPSGNSAIPVDFTTQPEPYVQLEKDARHYSDALGRTLTLIEGLFAYLDLERIFTGSETY